MSSEIAAEFVWIFLQGFSKVLPEIALKILKNSGVPEGISKMSLIKLLEILETLT